MWKKGSVIIGGCFFAVTCFCTNTSTAQEASLSFNRKKNSRPPVSIGVSRAKDTTIARQPLFAVLKELNQSKGIYFLFSDKSLGELMVLPIADKSRPVEQILEQLLQFTRVRYKKI